GDPYRFAVPEYLAGIGFERSEQHFDQRGFASAILAEKRVNLTFGDVEIDMVASGKRTEYLCQPTNLKQVGGVMLCTHSASHLLPDMFYVPASIVGAALHLRKVGHGLKELQDFQRNRAIGKGLAPHSPNQASL